MLLVAIENELRWCTVRGKCWYEISARGVVMVLPVQVLMLYGEMTMTMMMLVQGW